MTMKQQQIEALYLENVNDVNELARILETTPHGIRISVSSMDGYIVLGDKVMPMCNSSSNKTNKLNELNELKAQVELLERELQTPKLVNLTNHPIKYVDYNTRQQQIFPPSGILCRLERDYLKDETLPVEVNIFGVKSLTNYPDKEGEVYIVSGIVGEYLSKQGYKNYIVPDMKTGTYNNGELQYVTRFWRHE